VDFPNNSGGSSPTFGRSFVAGMPPSGSRPVTGVSQPHMHNVLKGKRILSLDMADQFCAQLHLDLLEFHRIRGTAGMAAPPLSFQRCVGQTLSSSTPGSQRFLHNFAVCWNWGRGRRD